VGGTGLKASVLDARGRMIVDRVWVDTPYPCPPKVLVKALVDLLKPLPAFDRVSIGFPGYIRDDKVITAPHFGNDIWHWFDLAKALKAKFGKPVRLLNDADMQGLAAIEGKGLELVVTLGTVVGTRPAAAILVEQCDSQTQLTSTASLTEPFNHYEYQFPL
jgi:polyphosphate glucokinase